MDLQTQHSESVLFETLLGEAFIHASGAARTLLRNNEPQGRVFIMEATKLGMWLKKISHGRFSLPMHEVEVPGFWMRTRGFFIAASGELMEVYDFDKAEHLTPVPSPTFTMTQSTRTIQLLIDELIEIIVS